MGRSERYIVGLDIGTSKVCTVVGEVADDGSLDVIGIGVSESKGLKRGVVVNLEAAVESIKKSVEEAELMAGVQFNSIEGGLAGSGPAAVDLSDTQSWVDPYFGVRLTLPRTDRWRFVFMGAIGGFGVGSDFAWQLFPQIGYRFHPHFELTGAFRVLDMKYDNGTGAQQFLYDLTTYGPQVGARFHF